MNTAKSIYKNFYGVKQSMEITPNTHSIFYSRALAIAFACFSSTSFATQGTDYITPAKYQTLDKYNVNMAGGLVSPTIETVAIGGALGLTHSISLRGNYFDLSNTNDGYHDKYAGGLKFTHLGTTKSPGYPEVPAGGGDATVMRASFLGKQADFAVVKNDGTYLYGYYAGTDYHYETVGDKRNILERRTDGLVWTQPDGTEVFLSTESDVNTAFAHSNRDVKKIVYPNGFTIESTLVGVSTNTGFMLKYDFDSTDPGLESTKQGRFFPSGTNVPAVSPGFRQANPKYVRAINKAIEWCDGSQSASCTLTNEWPTATFSWPGGMPRAMYIDKSTFSVTNSAGARTDFIYQAQDAGISDGAYPSNTAWKTVSPRLVEIKSAGATASTAFYTYKNTKPDLSGDIPYYDSRVYPGILTSAAGIHGPQTYNAAQLGSGMPGGEAVVYGQQYSSGDFLVEQYTTSPVGILIKVKDSKGDRTIDFEQTYRNFVTVEKFGSAPQKAYYYDTRGNVNQVIQGSTVVQAGYPDTCVNRKTCNQPEWVKDPNLKTTSYTYHAQSGQIQTIISPPNKNGISAVVRYGYELKYAKYIQTPGASAVQAPTGIWVKTSQKTCNNTATVGDACAGSSALALTPEQDEVVTTYKYDNNNLLLTEMTVKAMDSALGIRTKRTCFQYDIYGNRIGETSPNAQPASCTP